MYKGHFKSMSSDTKQTFGQRLTQIRKHKGLTQTELGDKIGVSQRIIHHYENKAEYPPTQKIIDIATALDMSIDDLLGLDKKIVDSKSYKKINIKLAKQLRLASHLPPADLKSLNIFIDALLIKNNIKDNFE